MDIHKESAKRVLDGDVKALSVAFLWRNTPQGYEFWSAIACGVVPLTEYHKDIIRQWLSPPLENLKKEIKDKWDPDNWGV